MGCLLASIGLHFREIEAGALVQAVGLMGGGAALYQVDVVVLAGDICRASGWHGWQRCFQLWRGLGI